MSPSLSAEVLDLVARRFAVLAEPTRMRLLALLSDREASVQELTDALASSHQNVSKHLGVLYQSGMVSRRKEGNRVQYALADYTACKLIGDATASITGQVEELAAIVGVTA